MLPTRFAAVLLGVALTALPAAAKNPESTLRAAAESGEQAVTVFVDAHFGARKDGAARQLSETHATAARHGFELVDVEVYTENGDLVGFFVSYRRARHPTTEQP